MIGAAFVALVLVLLVQLARQLDWRGAWAALQALPATALWSAAALCAASHALYGTFELIGRHQTGHRLPRRQAVTVGLVSYAFNLNLGALIGGVAFRYGLYGRLGLRPAVVTQVLGLSVLTNWLGYLVLAGGVLLLAPPALPSSWGIDGRLLSFAGATLWAVVVVYLLLCAAGARQPLRWRRCSVRIPTLRLALLQLLLSTSNWLLIAAACWMLLQQQAPYPQVLGVLLSAAVAGVVAHVPAGLGVLEFVFPVMLGGELGQATVLAALLAYRMLYYLAPLSLAALLLLVLRRRPPPASADPAARPAARRGTAMDSSVAGEEDPGSALEVLAPAPPAPAARSW